MLTINTGRRPTRSLSRPQSGAVSIDASENTKADLQQTLQDIKEKRAELDRKYDEVKNASQENWNDAKAAFSKTYYDVKADLKAAWDSVASKM